MNITKYRKYIPMLYWSPVIHRVHPRYIYETWYRNGDLKKFGGNHPIVLDGCGFWINSKELCTGYSLKSNTDVLMPIFSHKRQRLFNSVTKQLPIMVYKRDKSRAFVALFKKKTLPKVIVESIIQFAY